MAVEMGWIGLCKCGSWTFVSTEEPDLMEEITQDTIVTITKGGTVTRQTADETRVLLRASSAKCVCDKESSVQLDMFDNVKGAV